MKLKFISAVVTAVIGLSLVGSAEASQTKQQRKMHHQEMKKKRQMHHQEMKRKRQEARMHHQEMKKKRQMHRQEMKHKRQEARQQHRQKMMAEKKAFHQQMKNMH